MDFWDFYYNCAHVLLYVRCFVTNWGWFDFFFITTDVHLNYFNWNSIKFLLNAHQTEDPTVSYSVYIRSFYRQKTIKGCNGKMVFTTSKITDSLQKQSTRRLATRYNFNGISKLNSWNEGMDAQKYLWVVWKTEVTMNGSLKILIGKYFSGWQGLIKDVVAPVSINKIILICYLNL